MVKQRTTGTVKVVGRVISDRDPQLVDVPIAHARERWRIVADGMVQTIVTSASSTATMDEALVVYNNALRRLADR